MEVKEKEKWDCESILSTYSNIFNHPKLIKESVSCQVNLSHLFPFDNLNIESILQVQRIKVDEKTGIPVETQKLTKQALSQLDTLNSRVNADDEFDSESKIRAFHEKRVGKESLDEKKSRKRLIKELKRVW